MILIRNDAEALLLKQGNHDGAFLVRRSESTPGEFSISVRLNIIFLKLFIALTTSFGIAFAICIYSELQPKIIKKRVKVTYQKCIGYSYDRAILNSNIRKIIISFR